LLGKPGHIVSVDGFDARIRVVLPRRPSFPRSLGAILRVSFLPP
jgi:hypothetical protein